MVPCQNVPLTLTCHVSRAAVAAYTSWVCGLSSGPPGSLLVYFSANVHQGADRQVRTNRYHSSSAEKNGAMPCSGQSDEGAAPPTVVCGAGRHDGPSCSAGTACLSCGLLGVVQRAHVPPGGDECRAVPRHTAIPHQLHAHHRTVGASACRRDST
jgi:hypothetical protein